MMVFLMCALFASALTVRSEDDTEKAALLEQTSDFPPEDREYMESNIAWCIDPDNHDTLVGKVSRENQKSEGQKVSAMQKKEAMWKKVWKLTRTPEGNPLQYHADGWGSDPFGNGPLGRFAPHMILGLVDRPEKYSADKPLESDEHTPDSLCWKFNYDEGLRDDPTSGTKYYDDDIHETAPDPAGCRVFRKSFQPLQQLRQCIADKLDADPIWTARKDKVIDGKKWEEWCSEAVYNRIPLLAVGGVKLIQAPIKLCEPTVDTLRRAEEVIKMATFGRLSSGGRNSLLPSKKHLERKIQDTVTWPKDGAGPSMQATTVEAIRGQCFGLADPGEAGMYTDPAALAESPIIQIGYRCMPLMFDKTEIQGYGLMDGDQKFMEAENFERHLMQREQFPVPPVCARMALASLGTPNKYSALGAKAYMPEKYLSWTRCKAATKGNCRTIYFCWKLALNRLCALSPRCCPGEKEATHEACKQAPDSGTCPKELRTNVRKVKV